VQYRAYGPPPDDITTSYAARILRVAEATVRAWDRAGILPARRTSNGMRLFARADVERLRAAREAASR